ncbi:MAG: protein kinase [Vicinamibacteria bacterium]|nr:protein kinase [Vicinamibacteria bacterium]
MASRERVGKYVVKGVLGRGAMGEVLLGEDPLVGREVALKLMQGGDAEAADRFLQEARVIGSFLHPNIVMLYEFGFDEGEPFLAMERVEGEDLERWLRRPRSLASQLAVAEGLAGALAYAHARGVLHRDIKPSNVHVTPQGQAKLMDFGIARTEAAKLTATGTVLGTPMYMAPETLETAEYSERSDLYSLAVLLYEMWAGANPFAAPSIATTLRNVLTQAPADLASLRPDLPPAVSRAVTACLSKSPGERLPGVEALRAVLAAARVAPAAAGETAALERAPATPPTTALRAGEAPAAQQEPPSPPAAGSASARSRGPALAVAALAVAAAGVWVLRNPGPEPVPAAPSPTTQVAHPASPPPTPAAPLPSAEPAVPASTRPTPGATPAAPTATAATPSPTPLPTLSPSPSPEPRPTPTASPVSTPASTPGPAAPSVTLAQPAPQAPQLTSMAPAAARRGASVRVEVAVEGWSQAFRPAVVHGRRPAVGIKVSGGRQLEGGKLRLTVSVDGDAALGSYTLVLTDGQGRTSNGLAFEVTL